MRKAYAGLDIGTYHIKAAIAAPPASPDAPLQILGTGLASTRGMRHGNILEAAEVVKGIREAFSRAQHSAGTSLRGARVAIGGTSIEEIRSTGEVTLTPSGGVVSENDLERVKREAEKRAAQKLVNRSIVHTIPVAYRVDGTSVVGKPHGLQGTKLATDALIISSLSRQYDDLTAAVESAGIEVEHDVMASPLAASLVTLTKAQKIAGVALANIGAETTTLAIWNDDTPISVKVFPIGSADITHAIALAFQVPLTEAEQLKKGAVTGSDIALKKIQGVIQRTLKELFVTINAHLKTIGRQRMLPAGIVITGGGSGLLGVESVARSVLKLPASIGVPANLPRSGLADATWAVAYGLARWAYIEDAALEKQTIGDVFARVKESVRGAFRSLMP